MIERRKKLWLAESLIVASVWCVPAPAQRQRKLPAKAQTNEAARLSEESAKARAQLIRATNDYKASLQKLLVIDERNVRQAMEKQEKLKELFAEGLISKKELDESEKTVADARAQVEGVRQRFAEADRLVSETVAESKLAEQLAKAPPLPRGGVLRTTAYIRYNGPDAWSLAQAGAIQNFFSATFHRALPISAFGQTAVHDKLGFDHRNAMDVAVGPDSAEGQTLMNYLRGAGIPFIAFRAAVPGSATGPHIHVGRPSHRF